MQRKKGDPTDITLFLIMIFFLAISFLTTLFVNTKLQEIIDTTVLNESAAYSSISSAFNKINTTTTQRGFLLFFSILIIGILASSFLIRVHPFFIFLYIITLSFACFVAVYLANSYELVASNAQFAAISGNFTIITFIMQNIIKILIATGALSMIIIFGKVVGGGGGSPFEGGGI